MSGGKQFRKMFAAHIKLMFREKQVWFWNIFFPVILMTIFMVIFGGGGGENFKAKIAVVQPVQSEEAGRLLSHLRELPVFEWKSEQPVTAEQADTWVKDKEVDAAIVLPGNGDAKSIKLIVNTEREMNATTQAVNGILNEFVQQANLAAAGVQPAFRMETSSISSGSEDLSYEDFLMTGMMALAIAQGGLFGMVDLVEMRRKGLMKRLRMTPIRMGLFGLASMLVRFILGVFQIACLAGIGVVGFGAHLHLDIPTLIAAFFVGSLAFNAIGYLISSFSKSMEAYMGVANIVSFLMMFISGIFYPTSNLPDWLLALSHALPLTYFAEGLRDGMVYGSGIATADFWIGAAVLAAWGIVAYLLGAVFYRKTNLTST